MKEIRKIDSDAVRSYCIRNNYYTHGDNEEYSNLLLNLCKEDKNITVNHLEKIALDIMEHSNLETIYKCYNCTEDELKSNIMHQLNKECCNTFFE